MRPVILYTVARLGIFLATAAVLALFGARGVLLVLMALIISGIISFVLLSARRDAMSSAVTTGWSARRRKFDEARTKED